MFASATPTSKESWGNLALKGATPVEPWRSALTDTTGRPRSAAAIIALGKPAWILSFLAGAGSAARVGAAAALAAAFAALAAAASSNSLSHASKAGGSGL